jgi:hypothetical protein
MEMLLLVSFNYLQDFGGVTDFVQEIHKER